MTRLLVSVRDASEALAALRGGAALIDVKEPRLGSLGAATPEVWREVRRVVPTEVPCSAALGELKDVTDFVAEALAFFSQADPETEATMKDQISRTALPRYTQKQELDADETGVALKTREPVIP